MKWLRIWSWSSCVPHHLPVTHLLRVCIHIFTQRRDTFTLLSFPKPSSMYNFYDTCFFPWTSEGVFRESQIWSINFILLSFPKPSSMYHFYDTHFSHGQVREFFEHHNFDPLTSLLPLITFDVNATFHTYSTIVCTKYPRIVLQS